MADDEIAAALAGIRSRLDTLASITLRPRFGVRLRLARRDPCLRPS